ncbi:probable chitinase 10 [Anoplolepis gracilipes]|uniref:probable chitinase 10 n=1 Tax=Anoplolepis gracilipes TaxID=354296 RepID=UPI003BA39D41
MVVWITLLTLVGLSSAIPSKRRVPIEEILPFTPPRNQQHPQQHGSIHSFQRDAVERSPTSTFGRLSNYLDYNEFGSHRYPLRDAVESLPANVLYAESSHKFRDDFESESGRLPLRDAVEHREAPFLSVDVDHESIWLEPVAPPILRRTQNFDPKIVCRFNSRAVHRTEPFSLFPENVPDNKCTHLIYDAAILDRENIILRDPYDRDGYNAILRLRSRDPTLRVLISITNMNLHDGLFIQYFSNTTIFRQKSILEFLEEYPFDGIELDWPAAAEDWQSFKNMLKVIGALLTRKGYTLAVALRPEDPVDPELVSIVDLVTLRSWRDMPFCQDDSLICEMKNEIMEKIALHPGLLSFVAQNISEWIKQVSVEQRSKIVLALPIFGQGYTLKYDNLTDAGAPILGPGREGDYTKRQDGKLAYYEVCDKLERGLWISGRDEEGPYVKRGDQWIGYDDPVSVKVKIAYVRATGLGGVALWSLDLDDFQGICGNPWPMLNTAVESLGYYKDTLAEKCPFEYQLLGVDPEDCSRFYSCIKGRLHHGHCGHNQYFDLLEERCLMITPERSPKFYGKNICKFNVFNRIINRDFSSRVSSEQKKMLLLQQIGPRVVCYVTSWALYRKEDGKFVPENLDSQLCTDIVYAFAGLNPETLLMQSFDPWADIENNLYQRVTSTKGSRILLALGGWTDSSGDKYSRLISNGAARRNFVAAAVNYLNEHNFDGLSLEWCYPKCWQSDCKKGPDSDKPNFTKLIQELREEFNKQEPPLLLAVALSGYKEVIDKAYEVREISRAVDFMSIMTYDYHGAWESTSGHIAPLFGSPGDNNPYYNVNFTMSYLVRLGAEKSKLLVGIPLYGQSYRLSTASQAGLGEPTTGPGKPGEFTKQPGMLAYYEICDRIKRHGWKTKPGPSAQFEDQWIGYEDRESVYAKGKYITGNGYGGATMWTVDLDDFQNRCCSESYPLLKAINRALDRLSTPLSEDCQRPPQPVTPQAPTLTTHSDAANGNPHSTSPMTSSTSSTTWPSWTEKPSTTTQQATKTTWPTWTWTSQKPSSKIPEETIEPSSTQEPSTSSSTTTKQTTRTTWPTWTWTSQKPSSKIPEETTEPSSTQEPSTPSSTTSWSWTTSRAPTTRPTTTITTQESITTIPGTNCTDGEYYSDPASCSNYYRCVRGELRREQCAPGLHWDAKRHLCDWPSAAKCQTETASTNAQISTSRRPSLSSTRRPSFTTTVKSTSTKKAPTTRFTTSRPIVIVTSTQKPSKPCQHGQYYPYPNSCTSFLVCVNGDLVSRQCGPGLNWNTEKNMCDWAFKNPCVEPLPHKNALLVGKDSVPTTCIPGSYSSVPGDCKRYQACLWGRHEMFNCAPGLHFNKETRICDWPARAKCTNDDKEVTTQVTISTTNLPAQPPISQKPVTQPATEQTPITSTTSQPTSTLPSAIIDPEKVSSLSGDFKVVCYFTNWAWYRRGIGRYLPEHIDHTLCTHIVYGFAVLDYSELVIKAHDSWADYDNRFYERVVAYKKRGLKVLLALGGWNDSAGDKYSRLIHSSSARKKFIDHALQFIEKYGFDGLDLDWEYPVCWQVDCNKGPDSDKERFATLLQELSAKFKPKGLLLSAAVSPSKKVIDKGYDVPALARYLDWIAVMAYDYHGQWDKKTGHVAPMYYHPDDDYFYFNVNYSINYWISKGAPSKSIVMGMPLYGQSFTINDPRAGTGLNSPASAGNAGEFTRAAGFLSYYEICDRVRNRGWTVVQDQEYRMGPYAYKGSQWVSFDDPEMIRRKAQFVRDMNLGGGMVWALDLDDFRGRCGNGPHPLLHVIQQVLAPPRNHDTNALPENQEPTTTTTTTTTTTVTITPTQTIRPTLSVDRVTHETPRNEFKVICYFTNWAWYRQEGGRFVPEDIDPDLCTHVLYGFVVLDGSSLTIKSHDPWADIDNKFYEKVAAFKSKGIKVLMALGGWNDSAGDKYSKLVNSPNARQKFIAQALHFIEKYDFEGLDLDWEYPVCWQVECTKGPKSDKEGFSQLVKELSDEFKPRGLLLSAAVSPSKMVIDAGYDVPVLSKYLDWISVMTYDFHGQWDKKTGHVAPLYRLPKDWQPTFNANFSIHYWIEKGADPQKIIMGAPLYGQSFSLAERNVHGLNAPTYGGGEAGEATRARGFLAYYEICERTLRKGWTVVQDKERRIGPYAYKNDQWVSFDDAQQIKLKAEFIKKLGLGGGMVWALDLDDFKNKCGCEPSPLLRTMNRVLRNYPEGPLCPITKGTEAIIIDIDETDIESTTVTEHPIYESTTSPKPTYTPPSITTTTVITTTMESNTDDTIEIEASTPPPIDCGGLLFLPHKSDCTKYYLCNFGKISEQTCPTGLYWNENRCDWPENTKCTQTQRKVSVLPRLTLVENANDKKVICYYTSWSSRRISFGKFLPEDIDGELCTHIVYAFATLNIRELENRRDTSIFTIKIEDSTDDYRQFLAKAAEIRKRNGVKILLGLGGWNDSKDKYSRLADSTTIRQFTQHAAQFVQKHGFDGLAFDWEFPVCPQADCNRGPQRDSYNFYQLLRKFNETFRSKGLLLSIAVSASKTVIDNAYVEIPSLVQYVDWIGVMTYDYHNAYERETGHVAPLYHHPSDHTGFLNANFSVRYWLNKGVPANKIIMGIPAYGSSFTLPVISQNYTIVPPGFHAKVSGPGEPGKFTKSAGFLAFYEICDNVRNDGWSVTKDPEERVGPYASKRDQWVSYDDVSNVARKVELIKELNLGGGMIWSIDLDDFKDLCGCGKYPLLTTLNRKLGRRQPSHATDCT